MIFFLILFLWCPALALKLSLNQDLGRIQSELSPEEIGQFLHSITNLSQLAEVIDPSRSRNNFNFLFYYNSYGCSENRIFNWSRISSILINSRLTREDRLILLNTDCLARWPELFSTSEPNLKRLLDAVPESNPIKYLGDSDIIEIPKLLAKCWIDKRLKFILDHAQKNSHLNFIPQVNKIFKHQQLSPEQFSNSHFSLIGPEAIDFCFIYSKSSEEKKICYNMTLDKYEIYLNFSSRDLFYWSLNISTVFKYSLPENFHSIFKKHFKKLIKSCHVNDSLIKKFLQQFNNLILTSGPSEVSKLDSQIVNIFEIFSEIDYDKEPKSDLDFMVLVVDLFNWFESGIEFFKWDSSELEICLTIVYNFLGIHKTSNPDFFLNFYSKTFKKYISIYSFRADSFRFFIKNNYDPERPSHELLKSLRKLSWLNDSSKLKKFLKKFLSLEIRNSFLRKLTFNHVKEIDEDNYHIGISMSFDEDNSIIRNLFQGVYESFLNNVVFIYPLKANIFTSGILEYIISNKSGNVLDLEVTLNKFWTTLSLRENNFFDSIGEFDDDIKYELIPNPWTHPNILFVAGCVMTLAYLHGIKLTDWSLKYSLFASVFKLNLEPIDIYSNVLEENVDDSLKFYSLNDFIGASNFDTIKFNPECASQSGIVELIQINENLQSKTNEILFEVQKKFTTKSSDGTYNLECEISDLWTGEQFLKLEKFSNLYDSNSELDSCDNQLGLSLLEKYSDHESVEMGDDEEEIEMEAEAEIEIEKEAETEEEIEEKEQDKEKSVHESEESSPLTQEIFDKSVEVAHLQLYSMYLGLQPLTRFLKTKEVYEAIFITG